MRNSNIASPEAVEVARRFPTTLNPTLWIDIRPMALERVPGFTLPNGRMVGPHIDHKDALMYFSLRQPIELGHQTTHRYAIAKAALNQQQWTVVQAELLALVQTYRFFQTAAYRREKLRVANQLADFNEKLAAIAPPPARSQSGPGRRRVARGGGEPGDAPARRGRPARLRTSR